MTRRIGLLTLPLHSNYGGIVQVAALYAFLSEQGHQPILLRKEHHKAAWKLAVIAALKRIPGQNIANYRSQFLKLRKHAGFMRAFLPIQSGVSRTPSQLAAESARLGLDAVIVGSDQVWRLDYIDDGAYDAYFLSFLQNLSVRRISYAASFGTDQWADDGKVAQVTRLLGEFDSVSVREDSGVALCGQRFARKDAVHVLDPTLLVERAFHERVIQQLAPGNSAGGLYAYVLDRSATKQGIIDAVQRAQQLDTMTLAEPETDLTGYVNIGQWARRFRDADFVVTDSYHGMIFSIIFEKQFVAIGNAGRGLTRFKSLLAMLGLEDRLCDASASPAFGAVELEPIDYQRVNQRVAELREHSKAFLLGALAKEPVS
ncbi:polysaccharide pyruvyl transferase family protein [Stenotrophomonas sp. SAM-B]|uniref:polysaccharide pyruvyl transferase family protein n=1 Tax=Stenotrophomonas sp. SAM-B TaxID=2729141 RepID=UPI0015A1B5F3|nr:polysaccharide pyruvyl transferase family protein [Stenotrophomonas sp. SAM-B]NWF33728.1 polysaccharide pyruvyl transferase family protein [Stenotrophomonas sp. SAM-B]